MGPGNHMQTSVDYIDQDTNNCRDNSQPKYNLLTELQWLLLKNHKIKYTVQLFNSVTNLLQK
jgi:hypothetical protein